MALYEVEVEVTGEWYDFDSYKIDAPSEEEARDKAIQRALDASWMGGTADRAEVASIELVSEGGHDFSDDDDETLEDDEDEEEDELDFENDDDYESFDDEDLEDDDDEDDYEEDEE